VALNMGFYTIFRMKQKLLLACICVGLLFNESVAACVLLSRTQVARHLGWQPDVSNRMCYGAYKKKPYFSEVRDPSLIQLRADDVSFALAGGSKLQGHVEVQYDNRAVSANTAYIYRDPKTEHVTNIELVGDVVYAEPGRLMRAHRVQLNPENKTGELNQVLYRLDTKNAGASLPAWGRASLIQRFANRNLWLRDATYTTCAPQDNAWMIKARELTIDDAKGRGAARDAALVFKDTPVLYMPYLTFPTSKARKSGFLMPTNGYSNIGGVDLSVPYYWNIAPNYDATIVPHVYALRGVMIGGDTRFLTEHSSGVLGGHFLPGDRAFREYLKVHQPSYPELQGVSDNRWSLYLREDTAFTDRLKLKLNYQQISDDYYLQDFSNNMTMMTQSQLLRDGSLTYTDEHWFAHVLVQSYQTINPINQDSVKYIYERLPQLRLDGKYDDLPWNGSVHLNAQYDLFRWPVSDPTQLEGPRVHVMPDASFAWVKPWGYVKPEVQLVENYYRLHNQGSTYAPEFNRLIPRYIGDTGLVFERDVRGMGRAYTQTFEPRLYYLYVPYRDQSQIPAFESAYMMFRYDQLMRNNRFSGFDRISNANQLTYAFQSRFLSQKTGEEKAVLAVGQQAYFTPRRVNLCYAADGVCDDNALMLGYTAPDAKLSPITTHLDLNLSRDWSFNGGFVWDVDQKSTNNAEANFHYEPAKNHIVRLGYAYLVAGNILTHEDGTISRGALHQATGAYAWPLNENWSSLGVYSYNISQGYQMVGFLGVQYETCCWAVRAYAGRAFNSLTLDKTQPTYNNSAYVQVLLKGLGTVSTNDPASTIKTYLPGYVDVFHR
jgi:LPS-assembly protein